jgi:quercetin 2,3-dioxygenase
VQVHADAKLWSGLFDGEQSAQLALDPKRKGYVQLLRGAIEVNAVKLTAGDAALLEGESLIELAQGKNAEVLVFELNA